MEFRSGEIEKQLAPLKSTKEEKNETENTKNTARDNRA